MIRGVAVVTPVIILIVPAVNHLLRAMTTQSHATCVEKCLSKRPVLVFLLNFNVDNCFGNAPNVLR